MAEQVIATCESLEEAEAGRLVLEQQGITARLRPAEDRTEIWVEVNDAPSARRALLDDRLEEEGRAPQEMSLFMKASLVVAFLAVVVFAIVTIALG